MPLNQNRNPTQTRQSQVVEVVLKDGPASMGVVPPRFRRGAWQWKTGGDHEGGQLDILDLKTWRSLTHIVHRTAQHEKVTAAPLRQLINSPFGNVRHVPVPDQLRNSSSVEEMAQ